MQLVAQHRCVGSCRANVARIITLIFDAATLHEVEALSTLCEKKLYRTKGGNKSKIRSATCNAIMLRDQLHDCFARLPHLRSHFSKLSLSLTLLCKDPLPQPVEFFKTTSAKETKLSQKIGSP